MWLHLPGWLPCSSMMPSCTSAQRQAHPRHPMQAPHAATNATGRTHRPPSRRPSKCEHAVCLLLNTTRTLTRSLHACHVTRCSTCLPVCHMCIEHVRITQLLVQVDAMHAASTGTARTAEGQGCTSCKRRMLSLLRHRCRTAWCRTWTRRHGLMHGMQTLGQSGRRNTTPASSSPQRHQHQHGHQHHPPLRGRHPAGPASTACQCWPHGGWHRW